MTSPLGLSVVKSASSYRQGYSSLVPGSMNMRWPSDTSMVLPTSSSPSHATRGTVSSRPVAGRLSYSHEPPVVFSPLRSRGSTISSGAWGSRPSAMAGSGLRSPTASAVGHSCALRYRPQYPSKLMGMSASPYETRS